MKWRTALDPKTQKPVAKAVVSDCGAYHLCCALVNGVDHYMAWYHHQIIASGYVKARVLDKVNAHKEAHHKPVEAVQPVKGLDWFTGGEDAQIK